MLRNVNEATKTRTKEYTYDHVGRKTSFKLGINGSPEKILQYSYDPIGRQITKHYYPDRTYRQADSTFDYIFRPPNPDSNTTDLAKKAVNLLPGTSIVADSTNFYLARIDTLNTPIMATMAGMQKMDFGYHIRGLMNCTNCQGNVPSLNLLENDLFSNKLEWETAGRFDDNIGKQTWKNRKDNSLKTYSYDYDGFSRMTAANYIGNSNENYSLSQLTFDKNGNILKLKRKGFTGSNFGDIDNLTYSYSGNKLMAISDSVLSNLNTKDFRDSSASVDYEYYANGNLKSDLNKGISNIEYNTYLNRPKKITKIGGKELILNYDGGGTLISRTIPDSTKWQYTPDEIYKDDSLYQISQDEGRITRKNGKYKFEFEYRDIWGNLRTSFTDSDSLPVSGVYPAPIVSQINDYDPLGFQHFNNQEGENNKLFQNQERVFDLDLGWDFWKFRPSDALIGRFLMVDPLAAKFAHNSLYAFQENKLGLGVELEGAEVIPFPVIEVIIEGIIVTGEALAGTALGVAVIDMTKSASEKPGVGQGMRDSYIPLWVQQRGQQMTNSEGGGKYSHLKEPKNVGESRPFTKSQKKNILKENMKNNDGKIKSDQSGKELNPPKANVKGQPADMNQAEIDHSTPKSKRGSNSNSNARVISKEENLKKGNKEQ